MHYHNAHMEWQISNWSPWEQAVNGYNGVGDGAGDSRYMDKFKANLNEITGSRVPAGRGGAK